MKTVEEYKKLLLEKYKKSNGAKIDERYRHSLAVSKKALEIIDTFKLNLNKEKVEVAAILHDYAKYESFTDFENIVNEYKLDKSILDSSEKVLHAILGPYIIKKELGLEDEEILDAIKHHTTGSIDMSLLAEVIFLADYTDDTRVDDYFLETKKLSKIDFKGAIASKIKQRIDDRPDLTSRDVEKMYKKYLED